MSDFVTDYPDSITLDPHKRPFYTHGLVLGVDEFRQQELYHLEKQQFGNRGLHGYGTVCGLKVGVRDTAKGPEVIVSAGVAIDQAGREVRVPHDQCALLNDWLDAHKEDIQALTSPPVSPPATVTLYINLCYRSCETDRVPIPSGPCLSLDETTAPSRIADDFVLKLETEAPDQGEKDAVAELMTHLKQLEVRPDPDGMTVQDMEAYVRSLIDAASPPVVKHIHPSDLLLLTNIAFKTWVSEVRPVVHGTKAGCLSPPTETCVLLAELSFDVAESGGDYSVSTAVEDIAIDEARRPYLLHTQLLQSQMIENLALAVQGSIIDETNLVHISGAETITGQKSFAADITLVGAGRVSRSIDIKPQQAFVAAGTGSVDLYGGNRVAVVLQAGAEVVFPITIPDDIDFSTPMRLRLYWAIQTTAGSNFNATWRVRYRYDRAGDNLASASFTTVTDATAIRVGSSEDRLLISQFGMTRRVTGQHVAGTMLVQITDNSTSGATRYYLLGCDVIYTANRLGR